MSTSVYRTVTVDGIDRELDVIWDSVASNFP